MPGRARTRATMARTALALAAAAVVFAAAASALAQVPAEPWTIRSSNGRLDVVLIDSAATVNVLGTDMLLRVWNETFIAPVLRASPGDAIQIRLDNYLFNTTTNLHFHGFQVSPLSPADNSNEMIATNESHTYSFSLPADHPSGLFWYHSHAMNVIGMADGGTLHDTQWQVYNGMSGAFVIEGILDPFPMLAGIKEQILALRDINTTIPVPAAGLIDVAGGSTRLVNGVAVPEYHIMMNETQFWRVANIGADIFYTLAFSPPLPLYIFAIDGNRLSRLLVQDEYMLGPSARVEFFIQITPEIGNQSRQLLTLYTTVGGPDDDDFPERPLVNLTVVGHTEQPVLNLTEATTVPGLPELIDYRNVPIAHNRSFVFMTVSDTDAGDDANVFTINGHMFNMNRVDTTVTYGDVERWIIFNNSTEVHVRGRCSSLTRPPIIAPPDLTVGGRTPCIPMF